MNPLPIVYVKNMDRSLAFFEALGGQRSHASAHWAELRFGTAKIALHLDEDRQAGQPQQLGLAFEAAAPLEHLLEHCRQRGLTVHQQISDESFGRSLVLEDPDGLLIQVNEHDPELYGS